MAGEYFTDQKMCFRSITIFKPIEIAYVSSIKKQNFGHIHIL